MTKPLMTDAGSKEQLKEAQVKEKLRGDQHKIDLAKTLSTPEGRRVMWRILEQCNVFGSIWENSARIHYNAGQQDLGHWLMAEITRVDEQILFTMMKENRKDDL